MLLRLRAGLGDEAGDMTRRVTVTPGRPEQNERVCAAAREPLSSTLPHAHPRYPASLDTTHILASTPQHHYLDFHAPFPTVRLRRSFRGHPSDRSRFSQTSAHVFLHTLKPTHVEHTER